jgi:DNA-binding transcriptional regulator YdaS (Cro superfamily)
MKLQEYLDEHGTPKNTLAKRAGIHHTTVARVLKGHEILLSVALRIEEATKGQVTCHEMAPQAYLEDKIKDQGKDKKKKTKSKK